MLVIDSNLYKKKKNNIMQARLAAITDFQYLEKIPFALNEDMSSIKRDYFLFFQNIKMKK